VKIAYKRGSAGDIFHETWLMVVQLYTLTHLLPCLGHHTLTEHTKTRKKVSKMFKNTARHQIFPGQSYNKRFMSN